jgi:hypothetical protein
MRAPIALRHPFLVRARADTCLCEWSFGRLNPIAITFLVRRSSPPGRGDSSRVQPAEVPLHAFARYLS